MVLGGGGYNISNFARALTLAWAVMNGVELSDRLPEPYVEKVAKIGVYEKELRGGLKPSLHSQGKEIRVEVERTIDYLRKMVLPKILK